MESLPTIVQCYVNRCKTVSLPPGLADFLKGVVYLLQQSQRGPHPPSFRVAVDFSHHPMHVFLEPSTAAATVTATVAATVAAPLDSIIECFNENRIVVQNLVAKLQNLHEPSPPSTTYVMCHQDYDGFYGVEAALTPQEQAFMKSVLSFRPELHAIADDIVKEKGLTTHYAVLHLRMGDRLSSTSSVDPQLLQPVVAYLQTVLIPQWGHRILVLSDSYGTKKYLSDMFQLPCTDCCPLHLGAAQRFLHDTSGDADANTNLNDIAGTLIDFILMSRSSAMYHFGVYSWHSGFSKLVSHVYGIPYTVISSPNT